MHYITLPSLPPHRRASRGLLTSATLFLTACGGGATEGMGARPTGATTATEAQWRSLATPRPAPLDGSMRISMGEVTLPSDNPWGLESHVSVSLGVSELVTTGLLRRPDVHFVERRRFAAALEAERTGSRRTGAPALGTSPGAEVVLEVTWAAYGAPTSTLELRFVDTETGVIRKAWRTEVPGDADAVSLSRAIVASLVGAVDGEGRLPPWNDSAGGAAPKAFTRSGIPQPAIEAFLLGLSAEEAWDWEGARRGYETALSAAPGFLEARVALARTARLRTGGTLGAS